MDYMKADWYRKMSNQIIWFVLGWKYQDIHKHSSTQPISSLRS